METKKNYLSYVSDLAFDRQRVQQVGNTLSFAYFFLSIESSHFFGWVGYFD